MKVRLQDLKAENLTFLLQHPVSSRKIKGKDWGGGGGTEGEAAHSCQEAEITSKLQENYKAEKLQ